ncbi:MAG: hypothetical protein HKO57_01065, partial [Akkermansiaceae bacterium]|nr:hypothetical protein [Akkermansiaceae bacterium]
SGDNNKDPYKLHIGITPAVTLWNPYNVPLVLNHGASRSTEIRYFNLPFGIRWSKAGPKGNYQSNMATSLSWITNRDHHRWARGNGTSRMNSDRYTGFEIFYAGKNPIVFEPGEVKVFSLRKSSQFNSSSSYIDTTTVYREVREVDPGWDPNTYIEMPRSDRNTSAMHVEEETTGHGNDTTQGGGALTFGLGDRISFTVGSADHADLANGCAFQFFCRQSSVVQLINGNEDQTGDERWLRRLYTFISRHHRREHTDAGRAFARELMLKGFPDGESEIAFPPVRGSEIADGEHRPFLLVSLAMASEVSSEFSGDARGRRFVQRPFLHAPPVQAMAFVDRDDHDSFYFQPWNWWVQGINSVLEASIQVDANNVNSFYGGGYTPEFGNTHCVQMEVPLAPLHSIGALSHAKLGGYSLANNMLNAGSSRKNVDYAAVTATGANGLFPNVCQAIGNSYAHPYLAPDQVVSMWERHFSAHTGKQAVPMADHSYLANKALWDDYFFSSIAPHERTSTKLYEPGEDRTAREVATDAFFGGGELPNRRLVPHTANLTEERLDEYFDGKAVNLKGADEVAAHLMVKGPFNVNSTSVEAWKALLASLKDKEVASLHLEDSFARQLALSRARSDGAPVGSTLLPNADPVKGSPSDPSDAAQWYSWRALSDKQIESLAASIVDQVKQRGPFLSLSEFVNRRLDAGNRDLALRGALQAAIDDESIPDESAINAGFRAPERRFTPKEIARMKPAFKEALEGPVAYGSTAYIDQADILRHLGAQLTVRGDTFLIRTYGDSLDATGTVRARAWCEAVVQRVPEYLDVSADPAHAAFDDLTSEGNRSFGRPFRVVGFRWLDPDEV